MATLLSVYGGVQDVPNIMMMGCTNRGSFFHLSRSLFDYLAENMMDDAFKRTGRLAPSRYVGPPSPESRERFLRNYFDRDDVRGVYDAAPAAGSLEALLRHLILWTMNLFSPNSSPPTYLATKWYHWYIAHTAQGLD